ncbi:MAG TPA: xanthine dehydrogenase family protein subunit M [Geobacteraceae bacterium]|nr:xanthine dehydrogenase family protein subunit M [Geobacteraceae bacterium]
MKDTLYFAEKKLSDTLKILERYSRKATILAGGTDLVPRINRYLLKPEVLVYIGNLGLDQIREEDGRLIIGATTSIATLAAAKSIEKQTPILSQAARQAATFAIRSVATIGGNIANASPAADLVTPLLAMDAELRIASLGGERVIPLHGFFKGPGRTVLKPGELITEVSVPVRSGKSVFLKLGRRKAMSLSVVNVAAWLELKRGKCGEARIAVGGVAPVPLRCFAAEDMLKGKLIFPELIRSCARKAMAASRPVDDRRGSAWYRRVAGTALVARALAMAAGIEIDEEVTTSWSIRSLSY